MTANTAQLSVLVGDKFACIKIIGRANFNSSVDFKTLVNELRARGFNYFVIDLSECVLMDSTFLGVLTGFGLQLTQPPPGGCLGAVELLNPSARITDLLENLGVLQLFKLAQGPLQSPAGVPIRIETSPCTREQIAETCLEAHRTLMEANPENISRFKEVTKFLAEDLKKLRSAN